MDERHVHDPLNDMVGGYEGNVWFMMLLETWGDRCSRERCYPAGF